MIPTNSAELKKIFRFIVVGIITNLIGYVIFLLVVAAGVPVKTTVTALYGVGVLLGFFGNRRFTFSDTQKWWYSLLMYCIVSLGGFGINYALIVVFVDNWHIYYAYVEFVAIGVVAVYMFIMNRFFVFKEKI